MKRLAPVILAATLLAAACGSSEADDTAAAESAADVATVDVTTDDAAAATESAEAATTEPAEAAATEPAEAASETAEAVEGGESATYQIDVWADNWMAVYVDGVLIGEDSVPITTERSFNSETFTFEASAPFTLAIEAKDFKETDSGIEYIGQQNQQMGDGGIIAQVTNIATGEVVSATDATWNALVVHRAPLNTECVDDPDPDATCQFEISETPTDWTASTYDSSAWLAATEWSEDAVSPKDGYDQISWNPSAQLIWGTDLEVDNTVLLRTTVAA